MIESPRAKKELVTRLSRVEGQIRGIREMIMNGNDFEEVARQMVAAREAINKAFLKIVEDMADATLGDQASGNPGNQDQLRKAIKVVLRHL